MIVFCEDCGQKNTIRFNQINNDVADFFCESCQYHNRYACRENTLPPVFSNVSHFFDSLDAMQGIKGYFLIHPSKGVLFQRMPLFLNTEDLIALAYPLAQSYIASTKKFSTITDIKIILSKHAILMFHIFRHIFLIIVIDSSGFKGSVNDVLTENLILLKHMIVKQHGHDK